MPPPPRHLAFAVCAPGLEPLLHHELDELGVRRPRERTGGVTFDATTRQVYAANLSLRTATRIVIRAARFRAASFATLEEEMRAVDWRGWIRPGAQVRVRATSTGSTLYHTGAIEERVARFVGGRPATDADEPRARDTNATSKRRDAPVVGPEQLVIARIVHDEVTISIDSSGDALYKRGWRQATAKAPLRETLAAAMVLSSGWTATAALIDPMCGSGTIPIEAARAARGIPAGQGRSFAFQAWPSFEPGTWASVTGAAHASGLATPGVRGTDAGDGGGDGDGEWDAPVILGRDRNAGAIEASAGNAARAGVSADVGFSAASISDLADIVLPTTEPGWILTNPPYGARIQGGADLRDLYARFGDVARGRFRGWQIGLLVADPVLAAHTRFRFEERWRASNGGIPVQFLTATI